jgi:hypothetical protein
MYPHPNSYTFHTGWFNHYYTKVCVTTTHTRLAIVLLFPCCHAASHISLVLFPIMRQSMEEWDLKNERGSPTRPRKDGRLFTEMPEGVDDVYNPFMLESVRARLQVSHPRSCGRGLPAHCAG